jgi:hypothetical protein
LLPSYTSQKEDPKESKKLGSGGTSQKEDPRESKKSGSGGSGGKKRKSVTWTEEDSNEEEGSHEDEVTKKPRNEDGGTKVTFMDYSDCAVLVPG